MEWLFVAVFVVVLAVELADAVEAQVEEAAVLVRSAEGFDHTLVSAEVRIAVAAAAAAAVDHTAEQDIH